MRCASNIASTVNYIAIPAKGLRGTRKNPLGERWEYFLKGQWHRDHKDGPAVIDTNVEFKGIAVVEYYENGLPHRHPLRAQAGSRPTARVDASARCMRSMESCTATLGKARLWWR